MQCNWFVHESGQRWTRALHAYGHRAVPRDEDRLNVHSMPLPEAAFDQLAHDDAAVLLWELSDKAPSKQLQALAYLRNANPHRMQFVAFHHEAKLTDRIRSELSLSLQEIGAANVLLHVTDLALALKAVRRFWQRQRQEDNLATVRDIWDLLPWTP